MRVVDVMGSGGYGETGTLSRGIFVYSQIWGRGGRSGCIRCGERLGS